MTNRPLFGVNTIQGLGDIVITIPIARHYYNQGYNVFWPVKLEFYTSLIDTVPWINWHLIDYNKSWDQLFELRPLQALKNKGCTKIFNGHTGAKKMEEFVNNYSWGFLKFDQDKYTEMEVPLIEKWNLPKYITRNYQREHDLYNQLVKKPYYIEHTQYSRNTVTYDDSWINPDLQKITITPITNNAFDWCTLIDQAEFAIMVDSAFSNITDMLGLGKKRYFIPRSHWNMTPVLGQHWTFLKNPAYNYENYNNLQPIHLLQEDSPLIPKFDPESTGQIKALLKYYRFKNKPQQL